MPGAPVNPTKFHPVIQGVLLTPGRPLYISAHVTGGHGSSSTISAEASWSPAAKLVAQYLAPYLEQLDDRLGQPGRSVPVGVL